jgi:hypothetical protein
MIISFDSDDTLIPATKTFETEDQNFLQKLVEIGKIRKGTIAGEKSVTGIAILTINKFRKYFDFSLRKQPAQANFG